MSPSLVMELDDFVRARSHDIAVAADFGMFLEPDRARGLCEPKVSWRVVATAFLFWESALPVEYGIRTSADCLRVVKEYFRQNHKLHHHKH